MEELISGERLVGAKQTCRALRESKAKLVLLAEDAEDRITAPIESLCCEMSVNYRYVPTMKELGKACGISVGTAAAAVLR